MTKRGTRRASKYYAPLWSKVLVGLGSVMLVVSLVGGGYAKVMLDKLNKAVDTECLLSDCEAKPGEDIKGPLNFLMIGSDMRDDWDKAHSDSIMILHINKDLTDADIISIPRDLYVTIQECGDLYTSPCDTKINDAFAAGGNSAKESVANLATTVTDLTGVKFDGAAMVNFQGFTDIVGELGSVELCLPFEMEVRHAKNEDYPLGPSGGRMYPEGCDEYNKDDTLAIVRESYSYGPETPGWTEEWGISDFGRQNMQQHFIKQLLKKVKEEGYISNPAKVGTLIEAVGDQMLLDLGGHSIVDFAFAMRGIDPSSLSTLRIPSEAAEIDGTSFVMTQPGEQERAAEALYKSIREDDLDTWIAKNPDWLNKGADT